MPLSGLWLARIGYTDRESTVAYMLLPFAYDIDVQGTLDWLATNAAFQGITDAQRFSASLEFFTYVEGNFPNGNALECATLIFSTDEPNTFGVLDVPGCSHAFAAIEGCFAGHAIDITRDEIIALSELVTSPPALVTPSGLPFRALIAAGYRAVWRDVSRRSG
jgi:hypothetical protein